MWNDSALVLILYRLATLDFLIFTLLVVLWCFTPNTWNLWTQSWFYNLIHCVFRFQFPPIPVWMYFSITVSLLNNVGVYPYIYESTVTCLGDLCMGFTQAHTHTLTGAWSPWRNGNQMIYKEFPKGKAPNPSFRRNIFHTEQWIHILASTVAQR